MVADRHLFVIKWVLQNSYIKNFVKRSIVFYLVADSIKYNFKSAYWNNKNFLDKYYGQFDFKFFIIEVKEKN